MTLHVPTMLITAIVSALLVGLVLTFTPRRRLRSGLGEATGSALCFAAACTFTLLKDVIPDDLRMVPLNALFWMGFGLQWLAYARFDDPQARPTLPIGATAVAILLFAILYATGADYRERALFSSLTATGLSAGCIHQLLTGAVSPRQQSRWIGVSLSAVTIGCQLVRVGLLLQMENGDGALLSGALEQSVAFFPAVVHVLGVGLGFLLMHMERSEAEAQRAALIDPLTGCANRRAFAEQVARVAAGGGPLAIVVTDLDHFKQVNDNHGHAAGDGVIAHFAGILRGNVPHPGQVARLGGEEFCILLPGKDAPAATGLAEQVRSQLHAQPIEAPGGRLRVTASFGVAEALPGEGWEALFSRADRALYTAKREGRDRTVLSEPTLPALASRPPSPA